MPARVLAFRPDALWLLCVLAVGSEAHANLDDVREQLARDIQTAQRELGEAEATVSRERGELAERIASAQNRVLDLRARAVAARRLLDEDTFTLSQIESRLDAWQEQSRFQSRLLAGYLDRSGRRRLSDVSRIDLRVDLAVLAAHLEEQQARLHPGWQNRSVVLPDGEIGEASVLTLGPVGWFRQADPNRSGIVSRERDMTRVSMLFRSGAQAGIQDLYRHSEGIVTFDPTLSRALLLAEDRETLWQHLRKGGLWVLPIVLFALFASVIAVAKGISLYRLPALVPALTERVESALSDERADLQALKEQVRGPQAELLRIVVAEQSVEQRNDRLYAALLEQRNRLESWLGAIATTASVAPLLGLLGTVSGMILTFRLMTLFGAGDASAVSSGISEALITTELGLVVAIPALVAHALMSRKVKSYLAQLEADAVGLSQLPIRTCRA